MSEETSQAGMWCVSADRVFAFIMRAFPTFTKYGSQNGCDSKKFFAFISNEENVARIANGLFDIDCAYDAKEQPLMSKLMELGDVRSKAEAALRDSITPPPMEAPRG